MLACVNSYLGICKTRNGHHIAMTALDNLSDRWNRYIHLDKRRMCLVANDGYGLNERLKRKYHLRLKHKNRKHDRESEEPVLEEEISSTVRTILEAVVAEGGGKRAYIEGYRSGWKTATSEKLPRGNGKYISSFIGFTPVDNPTLAVLVLVNEPEGIYYGGTVCAPAAAEIMGNILPYIEERY